MDASCRNAKWYVGDVLQNGTQIGTPQTLSSNENQAFVSVGANSDGTFPVTAKLDDVRVYTRALSPAEVKQLYQLSSVRITQ